MAENRPLLDALLGWLEREGVAFAHRIHAPATSTGHAAELRGCVPSDGCKGLFMKAGKTMVVVAVRADRQVDNRALRKVLGVGRLRFATRDELRELTGCVPGQVPPFGAPLLPFGLVADAGLADMGRMWFTAGTHTDSIGLDTADWLRLAAPILGAFSRPSG